MEKTKNATMLAFEVDRELAKKARIEAARREISRSELIRRALVNYLKLEDKHEQKQPA